jgi:uncharacterized protein YjbI with pentapeptide repeats
MLLVSHGGTLRGVSGHGWEDDRMDGEPVEVDHLTLTGERLVGLKLDRAQVTDVKLDGCDLSGVLLSAYAVRRAQASQTRIRDCVWGGGIVQDASLDGCPSERWSLRFSTLQRVTFTDCVFVEADFYGVTFDRVTFERCDLTGAHFDSATVKELTFVSCNLLGVTGALNLKGAQVDLDDLPALAPSLAREAGIRINTG